MIVLRRGDRLPTVAVFQSFLNQKLQGDFLTVDGIFGPRTEEAIKRFQASIPTVQTGRVDYSLWRRVVGHEWQVIDSVDRSDHENARHRILDHEDLAPYGQTVLEQFGMSMGSPVVIDSIIGDARTGELILLRFHGHGSPGHMIVASGRITSGSSFAAGYAAGFDQALRKLRPLFAPIGSIELHGCRVGLGRDGQTLLTRIANAVGVPATGGLKSQYGGGSSTFRFEGPTRTIAPGGQTLQQWTASTCQASYPLPNQTVID